VGSAEIDAEFKDAGVQNVFQFIFRFIFDGLCLQK